MALPFGGKGHLRGDRPAALPLEQRSLVVSRSAIRGLADDVRPVSQIAIRPAIREAPVVGVEGTSFGGPRVGVVEQDQWIVTADSVVIAGWIARDDVRPVPETAKFLQ